MFITPYSRANPNFKECFSKHWPYCKGAELLVVYELTISWVPLY